MPGREGGAPIRSCIACGARREKPFLLRLGLNAAGCVEPDRHQQMPGRGAYVCRRPDCVAKLRKKGLLERAFKEAATMETGALAALAEMVAE